jgi:hypothetical protein
VNPGFINVYLWRKPAGRATPVVNYGSTTWAIFFAAFYGIFMLREHRIRLRREKGKGIIFIPDRDHREIF